MTGLGVAVALEAVEVAVARRRTGSRGFPLAGELETWARLAWKAARSARSREERLQLVAEGRLYNRARAALRGG